MIAQRMKSFVENSSVIREMFEEGKRLASIYGKENVYDFSLGNPSVSPPVEVKNAILDIVNNQEGIHGYMNNAGYEDVRQEVASSLNKRFETTFSSENIIMTVGAAGGFNTVMRALLDPEDEVITFSPYFVEYRAYVTNFFGVLVEVAANPPTFLPDINEFEKKITNKTKILILNSPNNPTGVVYSKEVITAISNVLRKKQIEYGHEIYIFSDEPYRELAYDDVEVPYISHFYDNTIIGYSFSKSLSLPGERIGYLVIPDEVNDKEEVYKAATIANRILGYVNAPSLMQKVIARSLEARVEVEVYDKNRELMYNSLIEYGYTCTKPEGAFYIWLKSPVEDEKSFCEKAKTKNILLVPGSAFSCKGYVRIAYCVSYDTIKSSLKGFKELAEFYGL